MGEAAKACKEAGGRVHGVTTEKLDELEGGSQHCDELEIVAAMPERRSRMMELADGFVILCPAAWAPTRSSSRFWSAASSAITANRS